MNRLRKIMECFSVRAGGKRNSRKGFMSFDMLFWLAMAGIILGGIMVYIGISQRDNKANNTIEALQLINTKLNELYTNERGFGDGNLAKILIDTKNVPASFIAGDDSLRTPWGEMTIESADADEGGGDNNAFEVTLDSIPQAVCVRLGTLISGSTSWYSVTINNTEVTANDEDLVKSINDNCSAGENDASTMVFKGRKQ